MLTRWLFYEELKCYETMLTYKGVINVSHLTHALFHVSISDTADSDSILIATTIILHMLVVIFRDHYTTYFYFNFNLKW